MDATDTTDALDNGAPGDVEAVVNNNGGGNNNEDEGGAPTVEETYEVTTTKRKTIRTSYKIQEVSDDIHK